MTVSRMVAPGGRSSASAPKADGDDAHEQAGHDGDGQPDGEGEQDAARGPARRGARLRRRALGPRRLGRRWGGLETGRGEGHQGLTDGSGRARAGPPARGGSARPPARGRRRPRSRGPRRRGGRPGRAGCPAACAPRTSVSTESPTIHGVLRAGAHERERPREELRVGLGDALLRAGDRPVEEGGEARVLQDAVQGGVPVGDDDEADAGRAELLEGGRDVGVGAEAHGAEQRRLDVLEARGRPRGAELGQDDLGACPPQGGQARRVVGPVVLGPVEGHLGEHGLPGLLEGHFDAPLRQAPREVGPGLLELEDGAQGVEQDDGGSGRGGHAAEACPARRAGYRPAPCRSSPWPPRASSRATRTS